MARCERPLRAWPPPGASPARSAPAIRGIAERAQQQRNVKVLRRIADLEDHRHLRVERMLAPDPEIVAGEERHQVSAGFEGRSTQEIPYAALAVGDSLRPVIPAAC